MSDDEKIDGSVFTFYGDLFLLEERQTFHRREIIVLVVSVEFADRFENNDDSLKSILNIINK